MSGMSTDPVTTGPARKTRTRFAPSPTGDLHLGNARTALLCWMLARRDGGDFVLRIEDTDEARLSDTALHALQAELRWLGLDWDEGPEKGGEYGPYAQSARGELYSHYYDRLEAQGLCYPCFCTPERLGRMRRRQQAAGQAPRYDGRCRALAADEVAARRAAGEAASLRFRVDPDRGVDSVVAFDDLVRGPQSFRAQDIGDFVIRRADGSPAFFFANAVDDALMRISHVIRGEDHLSNTPRQLMLLRALGLAEPTYAHASLLVGADGAPLAKRHGSSSLGSLRDAGYLPVAVVNQLARLGLTFDSTALESPQALAAAFDTGRLGRSPSRHDPGQLRHWQELAVGALDDAQFEHWLLTSLPEEVAAGVAAQRRSAFAALLRDNVVLPGEAERWIQQLLGSVPTYDDSVREVLEGAGAEFFDTALATLGEGDGGVAFKPFSQALQRASGCRGRALFMPLRAALSGELNGPELYRLWDFLGPASVRTRLGAARAAAAAGTHASL